MAAGNGTGNSGSTTGVDIPISMNSNDSQTLRVTDLISEGPIYGLVGGASSVFLNNDRMIEPSVSSESLSRGPVTITLTNNSTTATINNSQSTEPVTMNVEAGGTTNLIIRKGTGVANVTVDYYHKYKNRLTTSSAFFTSGMITSATRVGNVVDIVPARLRAIPGTSTTPDGIAIEGFLWKRESDTIALWRTGTYNDYSNSTSLTGSYSLELDDIVNVQSVNGTTITLGSNWTGTSGTYFFDKLGTLNMDSTLEESRFSQRVEGASVSFRTGTLMQSPMSGAGSTAISTAISLSLEQTDGYGSGTQPARELLGSGNIGLSAAQLEEVDKIKFRITYPNGFKAIGGKGGDNRTYIRYKIEIAIKQEASSSFGSYIVVRPALVHSGNYSNSRTFEHTLGLERFRPFADFKIRISRLDTHENPGYDDVGNVAKSDWTNLTTGGITGTTAILNEKLNHPYTALAETTFSTKEFADLPQRTYHLRGKLIRVPSNYVTREESATGVANYNRNVTSGAVENTYQDWNGSFRTELTYTNNPAWIYFDILTNNRYGLGDFIEDIEIDKYSLYRIARYCDELVSDGKGGLEPRYTLNTYMTKQADSYKVLKDLATNFLGLLYFLDGKIFPTIDAPASPVYNFTKANVIDGSFSYETTGSKTRINQVVVSWNNADNNYALQPLIVEDKREIAKTQRIITQEAVAYGCTSEAQATRYGKWKLWTAANQREIVSFSTGINGSYITPGDIINVQDSDRNATRYGGRISNTGSISVTTIPLDSSVSLISGSTYDLSVVFIKPSAFALEDMTVNSVNYVAGDLITQAFIDSNNNGTYTLQDIDSEEDAANAKGSATATTSLSLEWKDNIRTETRAVQNSSGVRTSLSVSPQFSSAPTAEHMWVLTENRSGLTVAGSAKEYRVLGIAQTNKNEYDITAVEHYDSKYSSIDEDFTTYVPEALAPVVTPTEIVPPVTGLAATIGPREEGSIGDSIVVSWVAPAGKTYTVGASGGGTTSETINSEYEHLHGYFIEHNFSNYENPLRVDKNSTILTFKNIPQGTYSVSIRVLNILENKSVPKTINVTSTDRFVDNLNRMPLGLPYGGLCSTVTTLNSSGLFSFDDNVYGFKPLQLNSARLGNTSTNTNTYQLSISGMPTITWTAQSEPGTFIHEHHYMIMRADVTSNMLKLLKYNKSPSHGVPYWFDAGNGSETTGLTSITGSLLGSSEGIVTGSGTAFTTELQVGAVLVVGSDAARVSSIKSNTILYIDRAMTIPNNSSASTNNYHFDFTNDTIISRVYKETNAGYQMVSFLSLDTTLSPQLGITRLLYALVTNNGSAPSVNSNAGTFADPAAGAATGWQLSVPTTTNNGDLIYAITRVLTSDGKAPQDAAWSAPFVYASRQDGERGAGRWHISVSSLPTTSSAANTAWNTGSGNQPSTAVVGDQAFFYTGTLASPTAQKVWIYAGSSNWTEQTEVIDGDLLVQGTVTADRMNVTTLSSITADIGSITAGTVKGGSIPDANTAPSGSEAGAFMDLTNGKMVFGKADKHILFDGTNLQLSGVIIDETSVVNSTAGVILQEDGTQEATTATTLNFTTGLNVAVTGSAPTQTATISLDSGFATLNGSTFTGSVLLPDQTSILPTVSSENYVAGTGNNNLAATTRYVEAAISSLVNGAPGTLNTLNELAEGLNDDDDAVATINTALTNRLRVDTSLQNLSSTQKTNALTNLGIPSGSGVTSVSGTLPISVTSGATPTVSISAATTSAAGSLSASDKTQLDNLSTNLSAKAPLANPTFTGTVAGISKSMIGLGSVDNTSDANKPVSTAQQTALNAKANLSGATFSGAIAMGTNKITGLGTPTSTTDAATKAYVDSTSSSAAGGASGTTYTTSIPSSTTKLRLSGSDSTSDDIEFVGSGATTVTRTNDSKFTISSTDTNINTNQLTVFQVENSSSSDQFSIGHGDGLEFVGSGATSISFDSSNKRVTISSTDTNTNTNTQNQYAISCVDGDNSDEEKIRLSGSGHNGTTTDDIVLEAGTGLSIARSGDKITFTNTDGGSGAGTVTSVGITHGGNAFNTGSAITTSGNLAITMAGSSSQYVNGAGNLVTFPSIPSAANNGVLTLAAGVDLHINESTKTFSADQSGSNTITFDHDTISRTNNTSSASPSYGGTFTAIDSITTSTQGHVTAVNTKTITIPASDTDSSNYFLNGISKSGNTLTFSVSGTTNQSFAFGSNAFTSTTIPSAANNATITISAGTDLITGGDFTTDQSSPETITINHANISRSNTTSTATPAYSGTFTAVDSITTNARGHVTAVNTKTVTIPASDNTQGVTSLSSTTTNQLTVTDGSTATPELNIVTGAVANSGTALATGDQIHTFVTGQGFVNSSGVTSVATNNGITGGTITGTGTIGLATNNVTNASVSGSTLTLSRQGASNVTFTDNNDNTTYDLSVAQNTDNTNNNPRLLLAGTNSTNDHITMIGGGAITTTRDSNTQFTISHSDTNSTTSPAGFSNADSLATSGKVKLLAGISHDTYGHITGSNGLQLDFTGPVVESSSGVVDIVASTITATNINSRFANFGSMAADVASITNLTTDFLDADQIISKDIRVGASDEVTVANFVVGRTYKVVNTGSLSQAQWNTIGGTTEKIYGPGKIFTAANVSFPTDANAKADDFNAIALINGSTLTGSGAHLNSDGDFFVGVHDGARIFFDQSAGTMTVRGTLNASDINTGTLNASNITVTNLDANSINGMSLDTGSNGQLSIGSSISAGNHSVILGAGAGGTGLGNTSIGKFAGGFTTGTDNVAIGQDAGMSVTTGDENIMIGSHTGRAPGGTTANKTGNNNIGIGAVSNQNTANGTLSALTSGSNNIVFGKGAGRNITTGSGNVIIGGYAGVTNDESTITIATGTGGRRLYFDTSGNATFTGKVTTSNSSGFSGPKFDTTDGTRFLQLSVSSGYNTINSMGSSSGSAKELRFTQGLSGTQLTIRYNEIEANERIIITGTGVATTSTTPNIFSVGTNSSSTSYNYHMRFTDANSTYRGQITSNQYGTQYTTSSDYRLKDGVQDISNATSRLKTLKPVNFKWAGTELRQDGFLAHEVSEIVPNAVSGEKDAVDGNGNPEYQGIDESKLVPLLVKTIQELEARITALENP